MFQLNIIIKWIKENRFIVALFLASTALLFYQHALSLSWDFSAYVLNAKYLFGYGSYFEWLRPPVTPVLMGLFGFLGWPAAEYIYIAFVSALFAAACLYLAKAVGIDKRLFYALMLNPAIVGFGLLEGTEMLSLALLMFFTVAIINARKSSGMFLSLGFLTRYSNILYLPILLFEKNWKKILLSLIIFTIPIIFWLGYNYIFTGDPFTSMADFFALNIISRSDISTPIIAGDFLLMVNYLIPISLLGLWRKRKKMKKSDWMMIAIAIIAIFYYSTAALKYERYLFDLVLPAAYFSSYTLSGLKVKKSHLLIALFNIAALVSILLFSQALIAPDHIENYPKLDCMISTDHWVLMNYLGIPAKPLLIPLIKDEIREGYRIVIYRNIRDPHMVINESIISGLPVINRTPLYTVFGNESICKKPYSFTSTYLEVVNITNFTRYKDTRPCRVLFGEICGLLGL